MRICSCDVSPSARRMPACIKVQYSTTAQQFPSSVPSLDQYLQSLIPPRWCMIFCRGQRTGNLPDKVRAQVLVNGGHCEGCAGDNSSCRIRRRQGRSRYHQSLAQVKFAGRVLLPSKARLLEGLRQEPPTFTASRDRMSVEARSWGSAPACAACEGVKAPFDGERGRLSLSCYLG